MSSERFDRVKEAQPGKMCWRGGVLGGLGLAVIVAAAPVAAGSLGLGVGVDVGGASADVGVGLGGGGLGVGVGLGVGGSRGAGAGTNGAGGGGVDGGGVTGADAATPGGSPRAVTAAAGSGMACARDGNETAYNGFEVRDRDGDRIGWVHEATVSPDGRIVSVRLQSTGRACYRLAGGGFRIGDGEVWTTADAALFR